MNGEGVVRRKESSRFPNSCSKVPLGSSSSLFLKSSSSRFGPHRQPISQTTRLIHPSAWKVNSGKSAYSILHRSTP